MFQVNLKTLLVGLAFAGLLAAYFAQGISLNKYQGFVPVVAVENVPADSKIGPQHLTIQYRQKEHVTGHQYSAIEEVIGKTVQVSLRQGEPLLKEIFEPTQIIDDQSPIAIPPGHKVVAIKVKQNSSLMSLLKPNDTIEVIGQHQRQWGTSLTTIRDLKVFCLGDGKNSQSIVGVLVDEPTSERLVALTTSASNVKIVLPTAK